MKNFIFCLLCLLTVNCERADAKVINLYYKRDKKTVRHGDSLYLNIILYGNRALCRTAGYEVLRRTPLWESDKFISRSKFGEMEYLQVNKIDGTWMYRSPGHSYYILKDDFSRMRIIYDQSIAEDSVMRQDYCDLVDYDIHYVGETEWIGEPGFDLHIRTAKQARADSIRQAGK